MARASRLVYMPARNSIGECMRPVTALLALGLLGGCAKNVKPEGPVITPYEHARDFSAPAYSGAKYIGAPHSTAPVLPFMAFGAAYDLDIVIGLKDDKWDMIEVVKLQSPDQDRPVWIVVESRAGSKEQSVVANLADINNWMPELPLARKSGGLTVEDLTTADGIDIRVKYDNMDNQPVELILQGDPPDKLARKRNGNTMGHSANDLLAVLDVSSAQSLFKADVRIDDKRVRARKIAGIVPMQFALTQTQGGVARGDYWLDLTDSIPFEDNAEFGVASKWEAPAPPPAPPVIPEPLNPAEGEEIVLLPFEEWEALDEKVSTKAVEAQEAQLDVCLVAAMVSDPEYKGLVAVDFHVKGGKAWEITVDKESTASELVMQCAQETIAAWAFDEALDGAIHTELGQFPFDHEAVNDLERAWMEANPPEVPEEEAEEAVEEGADEAKDSEELPEEGDLLDGDETVDEPEPEPNADVISAFNSIHKMSDGTDVSQPWTVRRSGGRVFVEQDSGTRKLTYEFLVFGEALELHSIRVENWGQATPSFAMTFSPALPDLARPFSGKVQSKFVMDVGGQLGHATGIVESTSADSGAKLTLTPSAPDWAASRPMLSQIEFKDGVPHILVRRAN